MTRARLTVVLVLLGLAAALWAASTEPVTWRWDRRAGAELTPATVRLLQGLEQPVDAYAFVGAGHPLRDVVARLLESYRRHSPRIQPHWRDPRSHPDAVLELGVQREGDIVLVQQGRAERVAVPTEARLSLALERLQRPERPLVAYLTGHGERPLLGGGPAALGPLGAGLQQRGYRVLPLPAEQARRGVPAELALLVVAAPRQPPPALMAALEAYLDNGGRLLWLADPDTGSLTPPPGLGIRPLPGALSDPGAAGLLALDDPRSLLLERLPAHPVTQVLESPLLLSGAVALEGAEGGWQGRPLLQPERSLDRGGTPLARPLLGVALTRPMPGREQRSAVLGDADLFSGAHAGNGDNLGFGLALVDWLTGAEGFPGHYQRAAPDQHLALSAAAAAVLGLGLLAGLPGLLLAGAARAWWRRRAA